MVCTVDHLASVAAARMIANGGNAVDAAVTASAVLAVTTQQSCGMGGDLWAMVHVPGNPVPFALNASGRAGSGSDAAQLRAQGHTAMPFRDDIRSTPVPGCVDGWVTLHERFGSLPLNEILAPAVEFATSGFPTSPLLAAAVHRIANTVGNDDYFPDGAPVQTGQRVTRPGVARSLRAIGAGGRAAWYEGEFGSGLRVLAPELFSVADLERSQADWVDAVAVDAWGHRIWSVPPNSQGYLTLAGAVIADGLELPDDPHDPLWGHLLIESAKQAAFDRGAVLFEGADGNALVSESRLAPRRAEISATEVAAVAPPTGGGGTIYLCSADGQGMGVSLIQSNASGFGTHLAEPGVGVFLQNRGVGFSLEEGHPAELVPGRRPPSTLSPALATTIEGDLRAVFGAMGGDGQPQVVLQLAARLLQGHQDPGRVITDSRFTLTVPDAIGFDTWDKSDQLTVAVEEGSGWEDGLRSRGHRVDVRPWGEGLFGHAHMIDVRADHLAGVADPRALIGAAVGV